MTLAEPPQDIPPTDAFALTVAPERDQVTVVPAGDLDLATADVLGDEVRRLRGAGFARVTVDLRGLGFMDSSGLRTLMTLRNDAARNGHSLTLIAGPPGVQRLFQLTATEGLFDWEQGAR